MQQRGVRMLLVVDGEGLLAGIVNDAREQKGLEKRETYYCRQGASEHADDPNYTIRAWRGVITYLLRRPEFLYE